MTAMAIALDPCRPVIRCPVRQIAQAWREHAQVDGISQPDVLIGAEPITRPGYSTGWHPRFSVPRLAIDVVIECAQPHHSARLAREWLWAMIQTLHHRHAITLWPREGDPA